MLYMIERLLQAAHAVSSVPISRQAAAAVTVIRHDVDHLAIPVFCQGSEVGRRRVLMPSTSQRLALPAMFCWLHGHLGHPVGAHNGRGDRALIAGEA